MPLVHVDVPEAVTEETRHLIGDVVYDALRSELSAPRTTASSSSPATAAPACRSPLTTWASNAARKRSSSRSRSTRGAQSTSSALSMPRLPMVCTSASASAARTSSSTLSRCRRRTGRLATGLPSTPLPTLDLVAAKGA